MHAWVHGLSLDLSLDTNESHVGVSTDKRNLVCRSTRTSCNVGLYDDDTPKNLFCRSTNTNRSVLRSVTRISCSELMGLDPSRSCMVVARFLGDAGQFEDAEDLIRKTRGFLDDTGPFQMGKYRSHMYPRTVLSDLIKNLYRFLDFSWPFQTRESWSRM